MDRHQVGTTRGGCLVGRSYLADGKVWRITADLKRHDGHFLFIRRDQDSRIIMREVLLDRQCIIGVTDAS
ncbi:MAG: hypothetical protein VB088_12665 [Sphaerochaeta sp.]|nr:hypothetical protein [Sphaerochaeta sp.]